MTDQIIYLIFDPTEAPPFCLGAFTNKEEAKEWARVAAESAGYEGEYTVQKIRVNA